MEHECIRVGTRLDALGTTALSWRDLWVIVDLAPAGSPVHEAKGGPWPRLEQLLAMHINQFERWVWMNQDPKRRRPFEPPIVFPWEMQKSEERIEVASMSMSEADVWLAARRKSGRV